VCRKSGAESKIKKWNAKPKTTVGGQYKWKRAFSPSLIHVAHYCGTWQEAILDAEDNPIDILPDESTQRLI